MPFDGSNWKERLPDRPEKRRWKTGLTKPLIIGIAAGTLAICAAGVAGYVYNQWLVVEHINNQSLSIKTDDLKSIRRDAPVIQRKKVAM